MVVKFDSKPLIFRGWPRIGRPQRMARLVLRRIERRRLILSAWKSRLNRRDTNKKILGVHTMAWQTPSFDDVRFGFEVTMYINNR